MFLTRQFFSSMPYKTLKLVVLLFALSALAMLSLPALAQQDNTAPQHVELSDIGKATVTLYYYDNVNGTKGDIVPMPDNPQQVNNDSSKAALGMYAFSHVPAGQWYYLEADNNGSKWYTTFYMQEGTGTKTANVNIPPFTPLNKTANDTATPLPAPSINATASPTISSIPVIKDAPTPTPGMAFLLAILSFVLAGIFLTIKHR